MFENQSGNGGRTGTSRRRFLGATTALSIGALGLSTGPAAGSEGAATDHGSSAVQSMMQFSATELGNQFTDGTEVQVDATMLPAGGYVAIHDTSLFDGEVLESVIGVTEYLTPGPHFGVPVTLFDVPGGEFDRDQLEGTTPLVAMPHRETGDDETYDFVSSGGEEDGPYTEAGLPAVDAGFATVDGDGAGETDQFSFLEFRNETATDGTVTVEAAVVSDGGFVALHDARLLQGDPFGSVVGVSEYLEPGFHWMIEIPIDDPSNITEGGLPARPLLPMPHLDTNGNQAYDFVDSEGSEDGPYTNAGQAVVDAGLVTVEE